MKINDSTTWAEHAIISLCRGVARKPMNLPWLCKIHLTQQCVDDVWHNLLLHCNSATWYSWHLKSTATWLLLLQIVWTNITEVSKVHSIEHFWGESVDNRWFPSQRASNAESVSMSSHEERRHIMSDILQTVAPIKLLFGQYGVSP